jgi:mannosyltransferase OCH1-like enzyme
MVKVSLIVRVVLIIILLYIISQALFNWYLSNQTPLIEKFSNINDNDKTDMKCKNEILLEIPLPTIPVYSNCEDKINKIEKIPMIIHQIEVIKCMNGFDSWRKDYIKQYPEFKYILWNKEKIDNDLEWSEELRNIYNMEKDEKGKTDIVRLMILQKYGGIFIDYDIVWNTQSPKSLEDLINLSNKNGQNARSHLLS